jgi:hypothetical protein
MSVIIEQKTMVTVCDNCPLLLPNGCEECGREGGCILEGDVSYTHYPYFVSMKTAIEGDFDTAFTGSENCPLRMLVRKDEGKFVPAVVDSAYKRGFTMEEAGGVRP